MSEGNQGYQQGGEIYIDCCMHAELLMYNAELLMCNNIINVCISLYHNHITIFIVKSLIKIRQVLQRMKNYFFSLQHMKLYPMANYFSKQSFLVEISLK